MDIIDFYSQNNEYKIQFSKKLKPVSWSTFAKYICNITFLDSVGNQVVNIQCSEKEFLDAMQALNHFMMNIGNEISDNIYFESTLNSYFIYVSILDYAYLNARDNITIDTAHPTDEEDDKLQISIYENSINGSLLRIYLEMDYIYLEDFIYKMYLILEDIPYLDQMSNCSLMELMEDY